MRSRNRFVAILAYAILVALSPAGAQVVLHQTVPAADGTPLATDVYLPVGSGPWPVILIRTPYGKDELQETCLALGANGYACVAQDCRGRFASGGKDTVFRDDRSDGHATLAWIAGQWWCDGNTGTLGGSALGITQYMLAPDANPVLRCAIPVVASADLYHGVMFHGGVLRRSLVVTWLTGQGSLDQLTPVLANRLWSDYWSPVDSLTPSDRVAVPALHMGGWFDIFGQCTLDAFATWQTRGGQGARGNQILVVGPWTHATMGTNVSGELTFPPQAAMDLIGLSLDFLAHWLKNNDSGVSEWPVVRVYLMGATDDPSAPGNRWLSLDSWPPRALRRRLHLADGGTLSWTPPPGESTVELVADPADPVPTLGGPNLFPDLPVNGRPMGAGPYDQRPVEARDDVLVFSTPPLTRPVTVMGRVTATLRIVPSTPDLDLSVRLTDVYPDGRSMLLLDGIARGRYRTGENRETFLEPGEMAAVTVDLWSTAIAFAPGHRIRIDIAGSNAPRFEVNPNDGTNPEDGSGGIVARTRILLGGSAPSFVTLPLVPTPLRPRARSEPPRPAAGRATVSGGANRPSAEPWNGSWALVSSLDR